MPDIRDGTFHSKSELQSPIEREATQQAHVHRERSKKQEAIQNYSMILLLVLMISKVTHNSSTFSHITALEGQPHKLTTSQAPQTLISANPTTSQVTTLNILFRQMLMAALFSLPPGLMMEVRLLTNLHGFTNPPVCGHNVPEWKVFCPGSVSIPSKRTIATFPRPRIRWAAKGVSTSHPTPRVHWCSSRCPLIKNRIFFVERETDIIS